MNYRIRDEILWKIADGEAVIVDPETENYAYLNSTGTEIWKMLDKSYSLENIENELLEKYDVPESRLKEDITGIINSLLEQGLIEEE